MRASIFLAKSLPWCLTKVAYFTEVDDELEDAGEDIEGPEPHALPEAEDENEGACLTGLGLDDILSDIFFLSFLLLLFLLSLSFF